MSQLYEMNEGIDAVNKRFNKKESNKNIVAG